MLTYTTAGINATVWTLKHWQTILQAIETSPYVCTDVNSYLAYELIKQQFDT